MSQALLVINSGSSSVKFAAYGVGSDSALSPIANGRIEGMSATPRLLAWGHDGEALEDRLVTVSEIGRAHV